MFLIAPAHALEPTWKDALEAATNQKWSFARKLAAGIQDPVVEKLVTWMYLTKTKGDIPFDTISRFIEENPEWPEMWKLRQRAEDSASKKLSDWKLVKWFDHHPPKTVHGTVLYVDALKKLGKREAGQTFLKKFWVDGRLSTKDFKLLRSKYKSLLSAEDHKARLDNLIWEERYSEARAILPYVDSGFRALANARIKLATNSGGVDQAIKVVPTTFHNDPGLLYERLKWRREKKKNTSALDILNNMPEELGPHPKKWWQERHIMARRAIEDKHFDLAYELTSQHRQTAGLGFAQAEWLSGWLALRYLDQPQQAFIHFYKLYNNVSTPISKARGAYWTGLAAEALGQRDVSRKWLIDAARHRTTFYGQLAEERLGESVTTLSGFTYRPSSTNFDTFEREELVRAVRLLHGMGADRQMEPFLDALSLKAKTITDHAMVANLALELGDYYTAVMLSKDAYKRGVVLFDEGYPILPPLPSSEPDPALVHAIIRQESAFNTFAISYAGARGLMQLMPGTARDVTRKLKTKYSKTKLLRDPKYNVRLGSTYLQQMLNRFDGSYILAIAAYNAGPGRVSRWVKEIGDPRDGNIDVIDWIELIPVYQTRNYVQRVLENFYVYRLRMSEKPETLLAQNK